MSQISPIFRQNWVQWQRPLGYPKVIYQVNKPFHPSTNPDNLVRINPTDSEPPGLEVGH